MSLQTGHHREQADISMQYSAAELGPHERFKILAGFVVPRPIAWVTSLGSNSVVNAAPFSFFNVVCEDPPLCVIGINPRPSGAMKDTVANVERLNEFVVNVVDESLARAMHESSADFPPEIGEPDWLGLRLAASVDVRVPRLADVPWSMECKTWKILTVNAGGRLIIGEGVRFHIRDELWDPKAMRIHMDHYQPVGRMFADRYCRTNDRVEFPTPDGFSDPRRQREPPTE